MGGDRSHRLLPLRMYPFIPWSRRFQGGCLATSTTVTGPFSTCLLVDNEVNPRHEQMHCKSTGSELGNELLVGGGVGRSD